MSSRLLRLSQRAYFNSTVNKLQIGGLRKLYSTFTEGEQKIFDVIKKKFPSASTIKVEDISGGCGAMYDVHIKSDEFKGKRLVQQHMMVNKALKAEIQEMHGIRISTSVSSEGQD